MADEVGGWVLDPKNPNRATYTDEDGFEHEQFAPGYNPSSATTPTPATATAAPQTSPEAPRGGWRRLADSFNDATQHGFPGLVARKWYDWTDYGVQDLIKKGYSPEEAEAVADKLIGVAQKGLREDAARKQAADPNWKPDESFFKAAGEIDKWGPWLAGQVLGSAGPESFVNPGGSAGARIAAQGAMGAASDAAYQTADLVDKVAEEFSAVQMLTSAAAGAGLQSAFEVPGFIRSLFKERGVDTTPGADPRANLESEPGIVGETSQAETLDPKDYSPEELAKIESTGMWAQGEDGLLHSTGEQLPTEPELPLGAPAEPAQRTKADLAREAGLVPDEAEGTVRGPEGNPEDVAPTVPEKVTPEMVKTKDRIDTITEGWKNRPDIEVFKNFDDVDGVEPNWIGFVGDDGVVRINSKAAKTPEMVDAVVFHEALGHYGLTQKFGDGLDKLMHDLYDSNAGIRAKADAYGKKFPTTYADATSPTARHVEEVLAEMSEKGRISPTIRGRIVRLLNELGRSMGLNIKYGDKEIRTILGMAHDAAIKGITPRENGFRLSKPMQNVTDLHEYRMTQYAKLRTSSDIDKLNDAIDYLDEAYTQGRTDNSVADLQDDLIDRLKRVEDSRTPSNNNKPETARERLRRQAESASDYAYKVSFNDERRYARRNTKAYKEWAKESDRLETAANILWERYQSINSDGSPIGNPKPMQAESRPSIRRKTPMDEVEPGETKTYKPYPDAKGSYDDYWRFRHRTGDGRDIMGSYTIKDGRLSDFSISSPSGPSSMGPKVIRQLARDLLKEHPEAAGISGLRVSGARKAAADLMNDWTNPFGVEVTSKGRPMQRTSRDDDAMTLIGSINPARIQSKPDIEEILEGLADALPEHLTVSKEQTIAEAKAMGINAAKMLKGEGDVGALTAKVYAARQVMTAQLNKVAKLQEKLATDGYSESVQADFIRALTTLRAVHATVSNNASELGRALASLRIMSDGKMNASKIVKAMQEQGNDLLGNPKQFMKFAAALNATASGQGTLPAIKMARQAFVPGAEKYIFSAWYNMLLSSPATHTANFVGTGGNFLADLTFAAGAAVKGQFGRNADRIRGREIAYRVWGALSALKASSDTWSNTRRVLNGVDSAGAKAEDSQHVLGGNKVLDFASGALEGPSRALAGADEFWKNVLQLSNIHGLAVRNAGNQGLKGKAFWDKVSDLITNPTDEMLEASADYAKVLQFQDKASAIGKALIDLQTPKANSTVPGRVARGVLKVAVPFVRTPDALIRTALRYTPLGAFERENIKGWKAGGAERDKVKARLIMGSAISFWLATQAYKGNITGQGPSDPKKKQEWLASHQENSIKVGDKYYSINGLEPVSTVINGIATLTERSKSGEIGEGDLAKQALSLTQGIGAVLTENSYMEGLNSLLDINDKDTKQAETAFTNFIAGLASSATTPAILRKYTQAVDPAVRDTTGDGSMYDRITGRIKSALPGLSEELPQRYDVYGRAQERKVAGPDLASRTNVRLEETDPVVKELVRLANLTDKVLVGAPGRNVKVDGVQRRLTAEEFQKYQHLSGYLIVEATKAQMTTPEWQTSDDAYKIEAMGDITKQMRQAARNYLFDPEDEETEDDTKEEED